MSSKKYSTANDVLFYDVYAALCEVEVDFDVACHFVVRRHYIRTRHQSFAVSLLARSLGHTTPPVTLAKEELAFPTPDGRSLFALQLMMIHALYNQLDVARIRREPEYVTDLP